MTILVTNHGRGLFCLEIVVGGHETGTRDEAGVQHPGKLDRLLHDACYFDAEAPLPAGQVRESRNIEYLWDGLGEVLQHLAGAGLQQGSAGTVAQLGKSPQGVGCSLGAKSADDADCVPGELIQQVIFRQI